MLSRPQQMGADPEEMLHEPMYRRKALDVGSRREASHAALPLTGRLMGDLRSIVRILPWAVHPTHVTRFIRRGDGSHGELDNSKPNSAFGHVHGGFLAHQEHGRRTPHGAVTAQLRENLADHEPRDLTHPTV